MTFSSRVICDPPPPSTRMVRTLGAALWVLPVAISFACLASAPSKTGAKIAAMFKPAPQSAILASAVMEPARTIEPERFAKVASTTYRRTLLDVRPRNEPKFPMLLSFSPPRNDQQVLAAQGSGEKSKMKVAASAGPQPAASVDTMPIASFGASSGRVPAARLVQTRVLQDARAIAPNAIMADGLYVIIAGIQPPKEGATCRRLDGVLEDCRVRAKARLSVLIMDRRLTCKLSVALENEVRVGQCYADKIDIAGDLLRQGLANRSTAGIMKTTL